MASGPNPALGPRTSNRPASKVCQPGSVFSDFFPIAFRNPAENKAGQALEQDVGLGDYPLLLADSGDSVARMS